MTLFLILFAISLACLLPRVFEFALYLVMIGILIIGFTLILHFVALFFNNAGGL